MPYSAAMIREMQAQESAEVSVVLMEIYHVSFGAQFFVQDREPITHNGQVYQPSSFSVTRPEQSTDGPVPIVSMAIQNVSQKIIHMFRSIANRDAIEIRILEVLRSEPEYVQRTFPTMKMRNIDYNDTTVRGDIVLTPVLEMSVSRTRFTPTSHPGLF